MVDIIRIVHTIFLTCRQIKLPSTLLFLFSSSLYYVNTRMDQSTPRNLNSMRAKKWFRLPENLDYWKLRQHFIPLVYAKFLFFSIHFFKNVLSTNLPSRRTCRTRPYVWVAVTETSWRRLVCCPQGPATSFLHHSRNITHWTTQICTTMAVCWKWHNSIQSQIYSPFLSTFTEFTHAVRHWIQEIFHFESKIAATPNPRWPLFLRP